MSASKECLFDCLCNKELYTTTPVVCQKCNCVKLRQLHFMETMIHCPIEDHKECARGYDGHRPLLLCKCGDDAQVKYIHAEGHMLPKDRE